MRNNSRASQSANEQTKNVFYICGLTGGPFFPMPAIMAKLVNTKPILIGVKNSYEEQVSIEFDLPLLILPITKLDILSFRKKSYFDFVRGVFGIILTMFLLMYSCIKSAYYLIKFQPVAIYSTGSFLTVPMVFISNIFNKLGITKTFIVIHQQDPKPGIANQFSSRFADLISCVFEYTIDNYPSFKDAWLIPNPIMKSKYKSYGTWKLKNLQNFVQKQNLNLDIEPIFSSKNTHSQKVDLAKKRSTKLNPLLLIFGGGSGSRVINYWVNINLTKLNKYFRIIHLTGSLQDKEFANFETENSLRLESVFEDMPKLLSSVDLVICRAGLGSISELLMLQKPAYIVPIKDSHQELNAEVVKDKFYVLDQDYTKDWIDQILQSYPAYFEKIKYKTESKQELSRYFVKLKTGVELVS